MTTKPSRFNNHETLSQIIHELATPVFIKDRDHRWVLVNQAFCDLVGATEDELIGKSDYDFFPREQADVFWLKDDLVFSSRAVNVNEESMTLADGDTRTLETKKIVFRDDELGDVLCGVITDITDMKRYQFQLDDVNRDLSRKVLERTRELEQLNRELKALASEDRLTGLMNRAAFDEHAIAWIERANGTKATIAFMFLDMDGLKRINDSYGHPVGDLLIQEAGRRLSLVVGERGVIARIGGDEFLVMMEYVELAEPQQLASRIADQMRKPLQTAARSHSLSCSIGIACYPDHGDDWITLFQNADCAMYVAKGHGDGGFALYQTQFTQSIRRKLELEHALEHAVANDQIGVHFQPILDCASQELRGFEALARWNSEQFGQVSPEEFIAVAEQSELIVALGRNVLTSAMAFIRSCCSDDQYVSVNVSARQLQDPNFEQILAEMVTRHGIKPSQLALEITESYLVDVGEHLNRFCRSPSLNGIRIFVDDFGTGYSNLMQLRRMNFDALKIDRDFIKDLPDSPFDVSLIRSISSMAREMGLQVIAEGIETESQRQCLVALGVPLAQGYLWETPRPAEFWIAKKKALDSQRQ